MEGLSDNFNLETLKRIDKTVDFVLNGADWMTRKELLEGLDCVNLPVHTSQLSRDIDLLQQCNISGFNYFKGDKGFDKSSATIMIVFRWLARNRSRGQGATHVSEIVQLIKTGEIKRNGEQQWRNCAAIEVKAVQL
ncbi:MAG: hypothetical protein F6K24_02105 [Okeania sp. SIO2D1]|nr:hypothetical protein [Okeania sp. SIO2D1]